MIVALVPLCSTFAFSLKFEASSSTVVVDWSFVVCTVLLFAFTLLVDLVEVFRCRVLM